MKVEEGFKMEETGTFIHFLIIFKLKYKSDILSKIWNLGAKCVNWINCGKKINASLEKRMLVALKIGREYVTLRNEAKCEKHK